MRLLVIVYVVNGLIMVGLAVPLIQRRVGPNRWYGFRVPATLADPDVWFAANSYSGRLLLRLGVIVALTAIGLALVPGIDENGYVLGCTGVLLGGLIFITALSFRYLHKLKSSQL